MTPMQQQPYLRPGAMKRWVRLLLLVMLALQAMTLPPALAVVKSPEAPKDAESEEHLLKRIDFGNAYIRGQTIQSGAVYLLQRKKSDIESLLKPRENYREEILKNFHILEEPAESAEGVDLILK